MKTHNAIQCYQLQNSAHLKDCRLTGLCLSWHWDIIRIYIWEYVGTTIMSSQSAKTLRVSHPFLAPETTERLHQAVFKQPNVAQTCTNYQAKVLPMVPLSLGSGKDMNLKTAFPQKKMMLYPRTITPPHIRPQNEQNPPPNPGFWTRPNSTPSSPQCSPTQHPNNSWVSESNVTLSQFGAVTDQKVPGQACGWWDRSRDCPRYPGSCWCQTCSCLFCPFVQQGWSHTRTGWIVKQNLFLRDLCLPHAK